MGGHHRYSAFWTQYMEFGDFAGIQKGFLFCSYNGCLGALRGAQKVQKWASVAHPVNIGHLDHYVVFGIKSGVVQDFQRGKKCPGGFKQTPLDPLKHPQTPLKTPPNPLNPIIGPPYNQFDPSSYLIL